MAGSVLKSLAGGLRDGITSLCSSADGSGVLASQVYREVIPALLDRMLTAKLPPLAAEGKESGSSGLADWHEAARVFSSASTHLFDCSPTSKSCSSLRAEVPYVSGE